MIPCGRYIMESLCILASVTAFCDIDSAAGAIHAVIFHDVSFENMEDTNVSPHFLRDILAMIKIGGSHTIPASEVVNYLRTGDIPEEDRVLLTFDDGYKGIREYAHPILFELGFCATAFIYTSGPDSGSPKRCSWAELREMEDSLVWEIHSHSVTHADLVSAGDYSLQYELSDSLSRLHSQGFSGDRYFAYPYGSFDDRVRIAAREAGYGAAFGAGPEGRIESNVDPYSIPRTTISQRHDQSLVCRKLGLDLDLVRSELAIYDEHEGVRLGNWEETNVSLGQQLGQYGVSFIQSADLTSSWNLAFSTGKKGKYSFRLWTPISAPVSEGQEGILYWRLRNTSNEKIAEGYVGDRVPNGWTEFHFEQLDVGNYRIEIRPGDNAGISLPVIVDALKIEYLGEAQSDARGGWEEYR